MKTSTSHRLFAEPSLCLALPKTSLYQLTLNVRIPTYDKIGLVASVDLVEEEWFRVFATDHFMYEARQLSGSGWGSKFWKAKL
jgi:hypothetical protein